MLKGLLENCSGLALPGNVRVCFEVFFELRSFGVGESFRSCAVRLFIWRGVGLLRVEHLGFDQLF